MLKSLEFFSRILPSMDGFRYYIKRFRRGVRQFGRTVICSRDYDSTCHQETRKVFPEHGGFFRERLDLFD